MVLSRWEICQCFVFSYKYFISKSRNNLLLDIKCKATICETWFFTCNKVFHDFQLHVNNDTFLSNSSQKVNKKKKKKKIVMLIIKAIFVINSCKSRLQKKIFKQRYYRYLKFSSSISIMRPLQLLMRKTKHNIFLIKFMGVIFWKDESTAHVFLLLD